MIKPDYIQRLKDRADIVTIIGEFIPLKKAGVRYVSCCPFHNESTPSFSVHPVRQTYYCFGCEKGGDIFEFVKQHKRIDFDEAVKYVAGRYNDIVEYESNNRPKPTSRFDGIKL